jgi:putative hydrolase of the HAD superfamily
MIDLVALDADDTLWHNEPLYRTTRDQFREVIERYGPCVDLDARLDATEARNLGHFGYGVKGFVLSMIETGLDLTCDRLEGPDVRRMLGWAREMLESPVELLPGVQQAIEELARDVRLILLTKGDLFHQESKLARSGLADAFSGVEIVSEKNAAVYRAVMARYGVEPEQFLMVGNSLRSDVLPVIDAGADAVYIAYPITWSHEHVPPDAMGDARFHELASITELPALVRALRSEASPRAARRGA